MSARAVARLSSSGEILAVLPSLCGFWPAESLVLLSLRGPRKRIGLTARIDLPPDEQAGAVAELCADRMRADGADLVLLAVFSEHGVRAGLVETVRAACDARGLPVLDALHVAAGRWTSYDCSAACCPPTGTPLPDDPAVLGLLRAEQVATGRVLLSSREELVRSVAGPTLLAAAAAERSLEEAVQAWGAHRLEHGAQASRRSTLEHARALLDRVADGVSVELPDAARLTVGLADVHARDELAGLMLSRSDELLSMLLQVARAVPPPDDAPVCTLLAWTAYGRGDGGLANVALDRALAGDPDYSLARLLRQCLDGGIRPEEVRRLAAQTGKALRRRDVRRGSRRRQGGQRDA